MKRIVEGELLRDEAKSILTGRTPSLQEQSYGRSSESIDQRPKHFIGSLGDFDAQFRLNLAHGHLDHAARQIRLLAAVYRAQAIDLDFGRLTGDRALNGRAGDLARSLIDTVLPCLKGAQTRVESGIPGDFHERNSILQRINSAIEADLLEKDPTKTLMAQCLAIGKI
jgi:hypothetical protein